MPDVDLIVSAVPGSLHLVAVGASVVVVVAWQLLSARSLPGREYIVPSHVDELRHLLELSVGCGSFLSLLLVPCDSCVWPYGRAWS